jgi:hypothetical protein
MGLIPTEDITKLRPRFKIQTGDSVNEVISRIEHALQDEQARCTGYVHHNYITLAMPIPERHYWSPQLTLTIDTEEEVTTIRGVYGPRPAVWTMFVLFYAILGLAIMILGTVGLSYMMLDKPADILWWVPILSLIFLSLYLVSYFGQKMAHNQTKILHLFFQEHSEIRPLN